MAEKEYSRDKAILLRVTSEEMALYRRAQELAGYKGDAQFHRHVLSVISVYTILLKTGLVSVETFSEEVGDLMFEINRKAYTKRLYDFTNLSQEEMLEAHKRMEEEDKRDEALIIQYGNILNPDAINVLTRAKKESYMRFEKRLRESEGLADKTIEKILSSYRERHDIALEEQEKQET